MAKLIPLKDVPGAARKIEAAVRRRMTRAEALAAAEYAIVDAPGTYQGSRPDVRGWVLTRTAADAVANEVCKMPDGSCIRLWAVWVQPGGGQ